MPKSEVLKKMIADGVAAELKRIEEGKGEPGTETETPTSTNTANKVVGAKVDLTNAELLEKLKEEKAKGKSEKVQCGGCGEIFEGEKEKCPKCGKTLEW